KDPFTSTKYAIHVPPPQFGRLWIAVFQELSPGSHEVRGVPVAPVLVNGRLKLADVLDGGVHLQVNKTVNVHPVVGLLRGRVEEVHHRYFVRAEITLEKLIRKVKPELSGTHCVDGVVSRHTMIGLVPALVPLA